MTACLIEVFLLSYAQLPDFHWRFLMRHFDVIFNSFFWSVTSLTSTGGYLITCTGYRHIFRTVMSVIWCTMSSSTLWVRFLFNLWINMGMLEKTSNRYVFQVKKIIYLHWIPLEVTKSFSLLQILGAIRSAHLNRWDKYSSKKGEYMKATLLRRCGCMDIKQGSGLILERDSVDQDIQRKLCQQK